MRKFARNMVEIDLDPVIDEALLALPFIRPEAETWFRSHMTGFVYPRGIREAGTRITPQERVDLGLEKWAGDQHLSWEIWNALTEKARANPAKNFDDLCDRIVCNACRIADRLKDNEFLREGIFFVRARFFADHRFPCDVAKATDGAIWSEIPEVPFASCRNRVCGCNWRLLSKRDFE